MGAALVVPMRPFPKFCLHFFASCRFVREGAKVTMVDLPTSQGAAVAASINSDNCIFVPTDITNPLDVENALLETKVMRLGVFTFI